MSYLSFWRLHDKLKDSIIQSVKDATIFRKHARRQLQRYQRRGGAQQSSWYRYPEGFDWRWGTFQ
jgi:hypothetical protein